MPGTSNQSVNRSHREEEGNKPGGSPNAPDSDSGSFTHPAPPQSGRPTQETGSQSAPAPDREDE